MSEFSPKVLESIVAAVDSQYWKPDFSHIPFVVIGESDEKYSVYPTGDSLLFKHKTALDVHLTIDGPHLSAGQVRASYCLPSRIDEHFSREGKPVRPLVYASQYELDSEVGVLYLQLVSALHEQIDVRFLAGMKAAQAAYEQLGQ